MSKFKTKREYEEEDTLSHLRRLENIQKRKEEKRAQGFDCTFEGCKEHFDNTYDLQEHIRKHQVECRKDMICTKPECKDLKVSGPTNPRYSFAKIHRLGIMLYMN